MWELMKDGGLGVIMQLTLAGVAEIRNPKISNPRAIA
jgi:hypothetical protein